MAFIGQKKEEADVSILLQDKIDYHRSPSSKKKSSLYF